MLYLADVAECIDSGSLRRDLVVLDIVAAGVGVEVGAGINAHVPVGQDVLRADRTLLGQANVREL